jgi:spermidine synthase
MPATATRTLFALTAFAAATLVFLVQPMVARQLLPAFGGTPAIWNTAVVFFQVTLLVGYALAHLSLRLLAPRRQLVVQLAISAAVLVLLPFTIHADDAPPADWPPAAWIVALLATGVGLPYLAVTTASPVLQRWYAWLGAHDSANPYFLYAASNAGSLVGLLAYPFLLEPRLGVAAQERVWASLFVAYLVLLGACALLLHRRGPREVAVRVDDDAPPIGRWRAVRWVLIAAVPAALMLGATTYITTDVASAPLLWVVPLTAYLASFMVTFGRRVHVPPRPAGLAAAASIVALVLVELELVLVGDLTRVALHVLALFTSAVLAHSLLYEDRPPARQLTAFYLLLSLGGALGGSFVALVAPAAFDGVYEYPLLLGVVLALRPAAWREPDGWREHGAWRAGASMLELAIAGFVLFALGSAAADQSSLHESFAGTGWLLVVAAACALLAIRRWGLFVAITGALVLLLAGADDDAIFVERNFYGTVRVKRDAERTRLLHGTTLHGAQLRDPARRREATAYYAADGPVGDVFDRLQRDEPFVEVGVVGLGSGALLAYERMWQRWTFYEIDPAVIRVARDPRLFTWISGSKVDVNVVEGDARQQLRERTHVRYDLLVLDAYSSDAVPVHLLTTEALELYADRLRAGGVLALHISSRNLALEPVVAANAKRLGLHGLARMDEVDAADHIIDGATGSHWVVLARDERDLAPLRHARGWRALEAGGQAWTDDRSNVAGAITWLPGWLTP